MLDVLIKDGIVITQNDKREIKKVNIGIENGIIKYVGNDEVKSKRIIDASMYIICPAYINSHIHYGEYYLRGYNGNITTEEYIQLGEKFYQKFKQQNHDIRESSIYNVAYEAIMSGSLTLMGVRGWPYVSNMPVNCFLGYPIMNSNKKKGYIDNFQNRFFELEKRDNTEYFMGLHSTKWVEEETLIELSNFLKKNPNIKLTVHTCESKEELEYVQQKYKMSPIELLYKYDLLSPNTQLIHCCYINDKDIDIINKTKASVVVCYNSNLKLGNKCCDIKKLLDKNINVMIGTDGPATCDSLNILDTVKTTALISKVDEQKLFDMITLNPAKYLNINTGSIIQNNKADLLFYEKNSTNITYKNSIINNLIYSPDIKPIYIMKDGKIIQEDDDFKVKAEKIKNEKMRYIEFIESSNNN